MKYTKFFAAACLAVALVFAAGCALTVNSYAQKQYDISMNYSYRFFIETIKREISKSPASFDSDGKLTSSNAVSVDFIKETIKNFNETAAEETEVYGPKVKAKSISGTPTAIAENAYTGKTEKEITADLKAKYPLK